MGTPRRGLPWAANDGYQSSGAALGNVLPSLPVRRDVFAPTYSASSASRFARQAWFDMVGMRTSTR